MRAMPDSIIISVERIASCIYVIRGEKVMIDSDLASLYDVETGHLVRAMKRNQERFPEDFVFHLSKEEFEQLKCQTGIASEWGGRRTPPYAFTEQGVAMLSGVLRSKRAVEVNLAIIRTFVRMRKLLATHEELARKVEQHDKHIASLYEYLRQLLEPPPAKPKNPIGFITSSAPRRRS